MSQKLDYPTDEILDRICDAHWNNGEGEGVTFYEVYTRNACNHTLYGEVEADGERYTFVVESGDINGTVVHKWGLPEEVQPYTPEQPERITFVPLENNFQLRAVYHKVRETPWFKELEQSYNYDRFFAPGLKTELYYKARAAERGLRPGYLSEL